MLCGNKSGAVAMEFVITLPIYFAFVFGLFELSDLISERIDSTLELRVGKMRLAAEAAQAAFSRDEEGFEELKRTLESPEYIRDAELESLSL